MPQLPTTTTDALKKSASEGTKHGSYDDRLKAIAPSEYLMIALDVSGSMECFLDYESNAKSSRLFCAKETIISFLNNCDRRHSAIGLASFSDSTRLLSPPIQVYSPLQSCIARLKSESSTKLAPCLRTLLVEVPSLTRVLLVSDGLPNDGESSIKEATNYVERKIPIDCVYIGEESDEGEKFMRKLAAKTNGLFFTAHSLTTFKKAVLLLTAKNRLLLEKK